MFKYLFKFFVLSLSIVLILSFSFVGSSVSAQSGTPISTKEEFNNIRNDLSGNYYLTCDIEFASSDFSYGGEYYNSGKCFLPIGDGKNAFKGTLDGRGYTVSGITVNVSGKVYSMNVTPVATGVSVASDDGWTGDYIIPSTPTTPNVSPAAGIFGSNQGTIKNLNVSNCTIKANSSNNATLYVGGIVGHNNGNILNCSVKNTLNCNSHSYIGGIAGYQSGGKIKDCLVRGKIETDGTYGSVVGAVAGGSVTECLSIAEFTGTRSLAAPVKMAGVDVLNNISNCYYIADTDYEGYGSRISVVDAKDPKSYDGFDFSNTWYMSGTLRRPALKAVTLSEGSDVTTGDLNANGEVDLLDLVLLARYVANWNADIHTEVANVNFNFTNGEDIVDLNDVNYLAHSLAGWNEAVLY